MENLIIYFWIILQVLVGYNLVLPLIFLLIWKLERKKEKKIRLNAKEFDFAIIVTAYQYTTMLKGVVESILNSNYTSYHIYVVTDNCAADPFEFSHSKVTILVPSAVLASNTGSHQFAMENFHRNHECLTIIDSDNLVDEEYLNQMNSEFINGFAAVQGTRAAKNLNTTIACLDAARDFYYHFYDGKVLFEIGSSATLAGSGMAFKTPVYLKFLDSMNVSGAGFDKVLQAWLVSNNYRIAFNSKAIVYDEKSSKSDQLVQQRSRWLNSWFKYAALGGNILKKGAKRVNRNQMLFGIILLRPPLFIFLALAVIAIAINLFFGLYTPAIIWLLSILVFIFSFCYALHIGNADKRIIRSLRNIPQFVYYQFISLLNARNANKISVSTKHYYNGAGKLDK
jgi:cellulose synthase/poly-beta-1,6-N-acetylglucosamine synthase-like glycosyltransferase